jgi:hypothetical protein
MRRVEVTKDHVDSVLKSLRELTRKEVLVGIPESTAARQDDEGPITNAALGYIHEFGAPGANIPARPFLIPGVRKTVAEYTPHLRGAAKAALDGNTGRADRELVAAGIVAEQGAKQEIHSGSFAPLSPRTIANRFRQRRTQKRRAEEEAYLRAVQSGVSPAAAQDEAGIRPLINTGQLAAALTSVVRKVR